jgi:hypothetical protein
MEQPKPIGRRSFLGQAGAAAIAAGALGGAAAGKAAAGATGTTALSYGRILVAGRNWTASSPG